MKNEKSKTDIWETWNSMKQGDKYLNDKSLIDDWLFMIRILCKDTKISFSGYRRQFISLAKYWLKYGEHDTSCGDPVIIHGQKIWDEYFEIFVKIEKGEHLNALDAWNSMLPGTAYAQYRSIWSIIIYRINQLLFWCRC